MKSPRPLKSMISSVTDAISLRGRPRIEPFSAMFSRPVMSGWKPAPSSMSDATRPWAVIVPSDGR